MSGITDAFKEALLRENEEFRRLVQEHQQYENRLEDLTSKVLLSADEQLEETTLKKKKLQIKDRMEEIARQNRAGAFAS